VTLQSIRERYPDKVAVVFAHSPVESHRFAELAARAAECAHAQGHFEGMRTVLFARQSSFGIVPWTDLAMLAGVPDLGMFNTCIKDLAPVPRIVQGKRLAGEFGVQGTPTILINGWRLPLPPSANELDGLIANVLAGREAVTTEGASGWSRLWN
jgi:protein-disulfide isomerase